MISRGPYVGKYFIVFSIVVSSNLWELYFKEKKNKLFRQGFCYMKIPHIQLCTMVFFYLTFVNIFV